MACEVGAQAVYAGDARRADALFDYVEPSATRVLKPGRKLADWSRRNMYDRYVVQRLSERTWFVSVSFYNSLVHVGPRCVTLVDPLAGEATSRLLQAVRSLTDLPLTGVVYSHYHLDHVEGIRRVFAEGFAAADEVAIIATDLTASRIEKFGGKIPAPTATVAGHDGTVEQDGLTIRLRTPEENGHCVDNAIVLLQGEGAVQFTDMITPGLMPFHKFGTQEDLVAYEENLRQLLGYDWQHINGGHGNVGGRDDVTWYLRYLDDLRSETSAAMERVRLADFMLPSQNHMSSWLYYLRALSATVREALRPRYGAYYGFEEVVASHVDMMVDVLVSY